MVRGPRRDVRERWHAFILIALEGTRSRNEDAGKVAMGRPSKDEAVVTCQIPPYQIGHLTFFKSNKQQKNWLDFLKIPISSISDD